MIPFWILFFCIFVLPWVALAKLFFFSDPPETDDPETDANLAVAAGILGIVCYLIFRRRF